MHEFSKETKTAEENRQAKGFTNSATVAAALLTLHWL